MNGWCTDTHRPSSSLHSKRGGSVIQRKSQRRSGTRPSRSARSRRIPSSTVFARSSASATSRATSPSAAPVLRRTAATSSSERWRPTGERTSPSEKAIHTSPEAPRDCASGIRASSSARDQEAAPGAANPLTEPPASSTRANALKPLPRKSWVSSATSIP